MRFLFGLFILLFLFTHLYGQSRKIIRIPDIPGYRTLKCDFHMHTIFSDGTVWPTVRVEEAWREGLDAISITDHIEYRPHSKDVQSDHNRAYDIAEPLAKGLNIVLIRGAEITRNMPPGHLNALFIKNANLLDRENVTDAIAEARDQGAFITWNHPGWKAQQPDTMIWWEEHTRLLQNNRLHGIEVFNNNEFYPKAVEWARKRNLSVIASSDLHDPAGMVYSFEEGHRPMTLVFSRTRTEGGIREAMFSRRTAAYFNNTLAGRPAILEPLFFASVKMTSAPGILHNGNTKKVELYNLSDIDFELELVQPGIGFDVNSSVKIKAQQVTLIELVGNSDEVADMKELEIFYKVNNMMVSASDNLVITLTVPNN